MKKYFTFLLMVFLLTIPSLHAGELTITEKNWKNISGICETKKIIIKRNSSENSLDLYFIKFNPRKVKIKILKSSFYGEKIQSVESLAGKSGAFCIINGGFFDENYNPIGVLISNGKILQPLPTVGNSSVFCVKNGEPRIIHRANFGYNGVAEALQSGPRLMYDGKNTIGAQGLNDISRRSGIGLDYNNNVVIYATDTIFDGLSFNELRSILKRPSINLKTALNLDGGRSTQLYFSAGWDKINIPGYDYIPVGIGFFKR